MLEVIPCFPVSSHYPRYYAAYGSFRSRGGGSPFYLDSNSSSEDLFPTMAKERLSLRMRQWHRSEHSTVYTDGNGDEDRRLNIILGQFSVLIRIADT